MSKKFLSRESSEVRERSNTAKSMTEFEFGAEETTQEASNFGGNPAPQITDGKQRRSEDGHDGIINNGTPRQQKMNPNADADGHLLSGNYPLVLSPFRSPRPQLNADTEEDWDSPLPLYYTSSDAAFTREGNLSDVGILSDGDLVVPNPQPTKRRVKKNSGGTLRNIHHVGEEGEGDLDSRRMSFAVMHPPKDVDDETEEDDDEAGGGGENLQQVEEIYSPLEPSAGKRNDGDPFGSQVPTEKSGLLGGKKQMKGKNGGGPRQNLYYDEWLHVWLYRIKTYFLLAHYGYILLLSLLGSIAIYVARDGYGSAYVDCLFAAISAATCTGLTSSDMVTWGRTSSFFWHLIMTLGSHVFTAFIPSFLRLLTLRKLLTDEVIIRHQNNRRLSNQRKEWGQRKRIFIKQLIVITKIVILSNFFYWIAMQLIGFGMLAIDSEPMEALSKTVSTFSNAQFSSAQSYKHSTWGLIVFCWLCPAGATLFPVFFRWLLLLERRCWYWFKMLRAKIKNTAPINFKSDFGHVDKVFQEKQQPRTPAGLATSKATLTTSKGVLPVTTSTTTLAVKKDTSGINFKYESRKDDLHAFASSAPDSDRVITPTLPTSASSPSPPVARIALRRNKYMSGFNRLLQSENPGSYHPFLFNTAHTNYLLLAWIFVTTIQFVPFVVQQWGKHDVLGRFSGGNKIMIALAQSIGHRFAGIILVRLNLLEPAHIFIIVFALFIPLIPLPSERTRRKWNQMVRAGIWRLLTSRFWWLFAAMNAILFIEEDRLNMIEKEVAHWDIMTRVIFEVISAYATSGLSLPLASIKAPGSFSASFSSPSKVIIMMVMMMGRHRGMDLGLDLGLTELALSEKSHWEAGDYGLLDEDDESDDNGGENKYDAKKTSTTGSQLPIVVNGIQT